MSNHTELANDFTRALDGLRAPFRLLLAGLTGLTSMLEAAETEAGSWRDRALIAEKERDEGNAHANGLRQQVEELRRALENANGTLNCTRHALANANATLNYTAADVEAAKGDQRKADAHIVRDLIHGWRFGYVDLTSLGCIAASAIEGVQT